MKYLFIVLMWLICPLGSASEFEIKPTHIISNTFSKEINGKELYWVDKTGQLNAIEVIKFSSEFKELNLLTTEEAVDFEKNTKILEYEKFCAIIVQYQADSFLAKSATLLRSKSDSELDVKFSFFISIKIRIT